MDAPIREAADLYKTITRVRSLEGDMTLRRLQVLLMIYTAGKGGISMQEIVKRTNSTSAGATKLVQSWTYRTAQRTKGPAYVVARADEDNLATKTCYITERGIQAVKDLFNA